MAALDFGMALARGLVPKSSKAQEDLINLAGGRNIFKSEDWWNKAIDEQVSSGYRKYKEEGREFLLPSGEYQLGRRNVSERYTPPQMMFGGVSYGPLTSGLGESPPTSSMAAAMSGWTAQTSISYEDPTSGRALSSRSVPVYEGRTYFTGGELSDIETAAKRGAARSKQEMESSKSAQKRLRRGTGGLLAKTAIGPESTGLSPLGVTGLGLETDTLGRLAKL